LNAPTNISRRGVVAGLTGLALSRSLPAQAQEPRAWLDPKLLAAAKKEGPLTVYSSTNEQEGLPLFKIFESATGIRFNYIRGNDASLISRIAIETRAKQPSFDIVHMTNAHKMPQALLAQFDPSEAKHINGLARDPDRRWYGVYTVYTTPAYNTKLVSKADLPTSFEDFAKRKEWAGKVAIDGTDADWLKGFFQHFGEAKATQIIKGMVGTLKPVITDGHLALARSVGAGEYWLSLNNYVMLSSNVQLAGSPIEIFPLDPVILFYAGVAVNAKAKSPNAARLAANFMLSREGQGHLAKFGRLPTRGDVQTSPPGIIERLQAKAVLPTMFKSEDERKWQQTFNALFKPR
jgi:iron(III) transport system substrate-binding protein